MEDKIFSQSIMCRANAFLITSRSRLESNPPVSCRDKRRFQSTNPHESQMSFDLSFEDGVPKFFLQITSDSVPRIQVWTVSRLLQECDRVASQPRWQNAASMVWSSIKANA